MIESVDNKKSFFLLLLNGYRDFDGSISYQLKTRKLERQLLPLIYFVSFALLIAKIPSLFVDKFQYNELGLYNAKLGSLLVVHLFFVPIFLYLFAFVAHLFLIFFSSKSSFYTTRLAFLWSLSLGSVVFVPVSLISVFITHINIKFFVTLCSELMVIYIFSRMLAFVSQIKNRTVAVGVIFSFYIFLNMLLPYLL